MTNSILASITYAGAALQLMLGEANFYSRQLNLPVPHPIQAADLKEKFVQRPQYGLGGNIATTNYAFGFPRGKLVYITQINFMENLTLSEKLNKLLEMPLLINTNQAHQLATQWLSGISIDVAQLEKKYPVSISQKYIYDRPLGLEEAQNPPLNIKKKLLPIFELKWGEGEDPPVLMEILGTTKQLHLMRIEDASFLKRPILVITNANIPLKAPSSTLPKIRH